MLTVIRLTGIFRQWCLYLCTILPTNYTYGSHIMEHYRVLLFCRTEPSFPLSSNKLVILIQSWSYLNVSNPSWPFYSAKISHCFTSIINIRSCHSPWDRWVTWDNQALKGDLQNWRELWRNFSLTFVIPFITGDLLAMIVTINMADQIY